MLKPQRLDIVRTYLLQALWSTCTRNVGVWRIPETQEGEEAMSLFAYLKQRGGAPDLVSFVAAAKACSSLAAIERGVYVDGKVVKVESLARGMAVHSEAAQCGYDSQLSLRNTLIDMYSKCGRLEDARRLFETMFLHRDVVSWNALILGYVENGEAELALQLFAEMSTESCTADSRTFVAALKACSLLTLKEKGLDVNGKVTKVEALRKGTEIHSEAEKCGCASDMFVASTMLDLCAKCGSPSDAQRIFDGMQHRDVVAWTALILAYAENLEGEQALDLFSRMQREGCEANTLSYIAALKACASLAEQEDAVEVNGRLVKALSLEKGAGVHAQVVKTGADSDVLLMNTLLDFYAKCGSLVDAERTFNSMVTHTVVSFNALMLGYVENGEAELALRLYSRMQREGIRPETASLVAVLKACGSAVALELTKQIHSELFRRGLEGQQILANTLVDTYGKCGSMSEAEQVFLSIPVPDIVSWNALLAGYSRKGDPNAVFSLFQRMMEQGMRADAVTFVCLLAACSHAGLIEKGTKYFDAMVAKHGVSPVIEHYHCLVDILGRGNQLVDAIQMAKAMPYQPNTATWRTVLSACRKWNNVGMGRLAFESMLHLDGNDGTAYTLMANLLQSTQLKSD